ncbi:MAG: ribonuclease T, partial [Methylocystis sp.]|nr:ribonuclease T [Methylocystis sp.]
MLEPGRRYKILFKNKPDATHYLVEVAGAEPLRRWVEVGCGEATLASSENGGPTKPGKRSYALAIGWQPAFCEQKPDKTEC